MARFIFTMKIATTTGFGMLICFLRGERQRSAMRKLHTSPSSGYPRGRCGMASEAAMKRARETFEAEIVSRSQRYALRDAQGGTLFLDMDKWKVGDWVRVTIERLPKRKVRHGD
jgi:hypothetical protein